MHKAHTPNIREPNNSLWPTLKPVNSLRWNSPCCTAQYNSVNQTVCMWLTKHGSALNTVYAGLIMCICFLIKVATFNYFANCLTQFFNVARRKMGEPGKTYHVNVETHLCPEAIQMITNNFKLCIATYESHLVAHWEYSEIVCRSCAVFYTQSGIPGHYQALYQAIASAS